MLNLSSLRLLSLSIPSHPTDRQTDRQSDKRHKPDSLELLERPPHASAAAAAAVAVRTEKCEAAALCSLPVPPSLRLDGRGEMKRLQKGVLYEYDT